MPSEVHCTLQVVFTSVVLFSVQADGYLVTTGQIIMWHVGQYAVQSWVE